MSEVVVNCKRLRKDGEIEPYFQMTFPSEKDHVYWQFLCGMLTEDEFLNAIGVTLWEERDDTVWQRVKAMHKEVLDGSRQVHYN